jgi:uncharacterized protein (DUF3084 family)
MNPTSVPFSNPLRPDLSLKRRGHSNPPVPMEADDIVPRERRISGPYGTASLQEAWDKLYKARAILEAEQNHLRDDRIALQGEIDALAAREQAVAAREARIQQLELAAALERVEAEEQREGSAIARLTRAPFQMARSVFGKKD